MYHFVHLWSILTQHPEPRPSVIPDNHGSSPRLHRTTTPLTVHYPYSNYQIIRLSPMQPSGVSPTRSFGYPRCSHPVLSLSTNKPCSSYPCTTYSPPWKPCCPQHADSIPLSFLARSGHFPPVPKWPHVQGNLSRTLGTLFLSFFLFPLPMPHNFVYFKFLTFGSYDRAWFAVPSLLVHWFPVQF